LNLPVKIRLTRTGRKKIATYRIVASDSRSRRDGRFLELLGTYYPQTQPKKFSLNADRIAYWLDQGAQPTETVANLLKQDRFVEKKQAIAQSPEAAVATVERRPERKRKPKTVEKKAKT
jgi:small subunit ribosomal protein S16